MSLNWQEVTEQIAMTETLSEQRLEQELSELAIKKPDIANELTRYYTRNGILGDFLREPSSEEQRQQQLLEPGAALGVWEILGVLGSGGMGDVYRARRNDGLYEQVVALKVIQNQDFDSVERFELERKSLASLEHPGISRIIDGGITDDGRSFMVMEYIEGVPLNEHIKTNALSVRKRLGLICDLCAAVAHAHSKLILHRDIKLANVLVDSEGAVRLIDFGISSGVGDGSDDFSGPMTIAYAPPEQLLMRRPVVGSDIFSTGVLLHRVLTGNLPGRNPDGSVTTDERLIDDADLSAIVKKATAVDPEDRYSSATLLSRDLEAYLNLMPVAARDGGALHRAGKFLRRNKLASGLAAAFFVALSAGLTGSVVLTNKATKEAARANVEAKRANSELERAEWNVTQSEIVTNISEVRADAFQYVFGSDEDQDALGEKFLEYLKLSAPGEQENNAKLFATKSWVVGKHFLDRHDYITARKVLEPWINAGYGEPLVLAFGQVSLAFAYRAMGEKQPAINMFKKAEEYYLGSRLRNTADHAVAVIQVANISEDVDDMKKATALIDLVLSNEETTPYSRTFLALEKFKLESRQADWAAAYATMAQGIERIEDGSFGRIAAIDIIHTHFARMNVFYQRDVSLATTHLDRAQEIADTAKGESLVLGFVADLRAVLAWIGNDYDTAAVHSAKAMRILEKYAGKADYYASALAKRGIIEADSRRLDAAEKTLTQLSELSEGVTGVWPEVLKLFISARKEGMDVAQKRYQDPSFPKEAVNKRLEPTYFLEVLRADGLRL